MSDWEPATEAEAAMRDALRVGDQEHYFRLLARTELILPVAADALTERAPVGWGTWTTDSRTHVLAFTSPQALDACLAEHAGTYRRLPFHELAASWPELEWWLAVNPGLPIEGYLPAWFVAQISRGDVRLPGRTLGARARIEQATAMRSRTSSPPAASPIAPLGAPPAPRPTAGASGGVPGGAARTAPGGQADRTAGFGAAAPADSYGPGGRDFPRRGDLLSRRGFPRRGSDSGALPRRDANPDSFPGSGSGGDAAPSQGAASYGGPGPAGLTYGEPGPADEARTAAGYPLAAGFEGGYTPATGYSAAPVSGGPVSNAEPVSGGPVSSAAPVSGGTSPTSPSPVAPPEPPPAEESDLTPANQVEEGLLDAVSEGSTDRFLSTLLLAKVLVPGPYDDALANIDQWSTEQIDGHPYVVVFTSNEMLGRHLGEDVPATWIKFTQLIHAWPDESLSFAVNLGTPIGATLPGSQIVALASWADEVGLTDERPEPAPAPEPARRSAPPQPTGPIVMQKTIPGQQVPYYLDRGYDRVSGFVHRASEVSHLRTPADLYNALGLSYSDSPFKPDDAEVFVLRWAAHRGNLYRIPYGGQHEAAMHAMQGWVIERAPFRGNGFAPSESRDVIAEFKVDSVRLPHGAELWRVDRDGNEKLIAMFDADGPRWQRVGGEE